MNYKIEKKPNLYSVFISRGYYSDHEEDFLLFAANSPEEAWEFLCAYIDEMDVAKGNSDHNWSFRYAAVRMDTRIHKNKNLTNDVPDCSDSMWRVKIEMASVIYTQDYTKK